MLVGTRDAPTLDKRIPKSLCDFNRFQFGNG